MTTGTGTDTIAFGDGSPGRGLPPREREDTGRKRPLLVGGVAALVLALAGGAFAAYSIGVFGAVGPQPDTVIPANALVYAAVDLNPSAKEKLGAYQLAKKFDDNVKLTSVDTFKDDVLAELIESEGSYDYEKDFKPWIGDRVALALLPAPGTGDGITPVLAVESHDEAKATAAMDAIRARGSDPGVDDQQELAYAFRDSFVLISDDQQELDAAVTATETLDADPTYTHDMAALGGDQIARVWVDLAGVAAALPADIGSELPPEALAELTGTIATGIHADADYLEYTSHTFGVGALEALQGAAPVGLVDTFPEDADLAVEVSNLGAMLADAGELFRESDFLGIEDDLGVDASAESLLAMFGTDFAAVSAIADEFRLAGRVTTGDAERGQQLATSLVEEADPGFLTRPVDGGYAFGFDDAWLATAAERSGTLAETEEFQRAVGDTGDAIAVLFVDLDAVLAALDSGNGDFVEEYDALDAVGVVASMDGDHGQMRLRITVD